MSANTKALRSRIKSVDSTLHLTKAMGLVASSKMRRTVLAMEKARQYEKTFDEAMDVLLGCPECKRSSFTKQRTGNRQKIIVIAGDRGLAGGYNANVFRFMRDYKDAEVIAIGKRAFDKYGVGYKSAEDFTISDAVELAKNLCDEFSNNQIDKLGIVRTEYISMMSQEVSIRWILPLVPREEKRAGVIFEPDESTILSAVIIEYIAGQIVKDVRESFASEIAARRVAMDSAGKNAKEMIDNLQLEYNRARQGAITQELNEIVAGSGR